MPPVSDRRKTKAQLLAELDELRERLARLEGNGTGRAESPRPSSRLAQALLNAVGEAVIATDAEGKILYWNRAAEDLYGYAATEVMGRPVLEVTVPAGDQAEAAEIMGRATRAGPWSGQFQVRRKDGALFPAWVSLAPYHEGERLAGFIGISSDISERTRMQEELRNSRQIYRDFIAQSLEAVWRFEISEPIPVDLPPEEQIRRFYATARLVECNDAMARTFGIPGAAQLIGTPPASLLSPENAHNQAALHDFIQAGHHLENREFRLIERDGRRRYFLANMVGVVHGGRLEQVWGTLTEITRRRAAELAARERERELRAITNVVPALISRMDRDLRLRFVNTTWETWWGIPGSEALGQPIAEIMGAEQFREVREYLQRALEGQASTFEIPFRFADRVRQIRASCLPDRDDRGRVLGVVTMVTDLTERVMAERALEESELRYRLAALATSDTIWDWNLATGAIAWSPGLETTFGGRADQVATFDAWAGLIHPDDQDRVSGSLRRLLETREQTWRAEYRMRRGDGGWAEVLNQAFVAHDEAGQAARVVGAITDFTERNRAERELRASETRFRQLADAMPQIVWSSLADGTLDYYNRRWYEATGATPDEIGDQSWLPVLHPDDRQRTLNRWYHSVRTGQEYEIEYRFRDPATGGYRWHLGRALPARDEQGRIVRWFGSSTDIHDHKQVEEALRESEGQLRLALDSTAMGLWEFEIPTGRVKWSEGVEPLYGMAPGSFSGTYEAFLDTLHPDDAPRVVEAVRRAIEDNAEYDLAFRVLWPDGSSHWLIGRGQVFRDAVGRPQRMLGITMDITARKRAEQQVLAEHTVTRILAETPGTKDPVPAVMRALGELLEYRVAAFWVPAEGGEYLRCADAWSDPARPAPQYLALTRTTLFRTGDGLPGRVWSGRSPAWIDRLGEAPDLPRREAARDEGLRSAVAFPVTVGEEFIGVLEFVAGRLEVLDDSYRHMVDSVASELGQFIARRRAERALAEQAALLELSYDAIIVSDLDGRVQYWNHGAEQMYGWPRGDATGRIVAELLHTELPASREEIQEQLRREGRWHGEVVRTRQNGRQITVASRSSLLRNDLGEPYRILEISSDLTDRLQAMEALRQSEERFRVTLKSSPIMVLHQDRELRYTWAHNTHSTFPPEQVVGRTDDELVPPALAERFRRLKRGIFATGEGTRTEVDMEIGGEPRTWDVTIEPLRNGEGAITGLTTAAVDITSRKWTERRVLAEHAVSRILTEAATTEEALPAIVEAIARHLEFAAVELWLPSKGDSCLRLGALWTRPDSRFDQWREAALGQTFRVGEGVPGRVWATRAPVLDRDLADSADFLRREAGAAAGLRGGLCVPLLVPGGEGQSGVLGVLACYSGQVARPDDALLQTILAIAAEIGQYVRRRRAEDQRREAEHRLRFLAEASTVLASSLEYQRTLTHVARLAVPVLADWCAIDLVEADGSVRRVAIHHQNPAKVELARELMQRYPPDLDAPRGLGQVLRSGEPEVASEIPPALIEASAPDARWLEIIREIGLRSFIIVPMVIHDRVLGAITLVSAESGRRFTGDDLSLPQDLAYRAAVAVDNARLFREAQEAAERREEILRLLDTVLAAAPVGLAFLDTELRYARINTALASLDGMTPAEIVGRSLFEVIPDLAPDLAPIFRRVLETGEPVLGVEMAWNPPGLPGETRYRLQSFYPVAGANGQVVWVGTVVADITERKQAEDALRDFARRLERSNQELENFAYIASHDLQEPLRMVSSYTQLLAKRYRGRLDSDADDFINYAVEGVTRMRALITDLLAVSRVDKKGAAFQPTDFNQVVERAQAVLHPVLEQARAELVVGELPALPADQSQMQQVFQNLLGNALKFRRPDRGLHMEIGAEREGEEWVFRVRDNGIGIDPQHLERIFIMFQRLHTRAEYPGTGIGLAIVKKIIERHGGRIWAESKPGEGATFLFTLPVKTEKSETPD